MLTTYLEQRETLVRLFSRRTGDMGVAEDVIQELYLRLDAVAEEGRIDNPLAFLLRMANNLYLNRVRSSTSERRRERAWHDAGREAAVEGVEPAADEPTPEAQVSSRQQLLLLVSTLKELPDKTQDIFRLHKIDGLSQAEVAKRLEISISSVEKHLSSALRHLMLRMKAKGGP